RAADRPGRPPGAVPLQDRPGPVTSDGPDVVGIGAPYAVQEFPGTAGLHGPSRSVPHLDRPSDGPDVAGVGAPHAIEGDGAARLGRPPGPVPLQDRPG